LAVPQESRESRSERLTEKRSGSLSIYVLCSVLVKFDLNVLSSR
jgi:hypothetical protein